MARTPDAKRASVVFDLRDLTMSMNDIARANRISLSTVYHIAHEFNVNIKERNRILFLLHKRKTLANEIRELNERFQSNIKEL